MYTSSLCFVHLEQDWLALGLVPLRPYTHIVSPSFQLDWETEVLVKHKIYPMTTIQSQRNSDNLVVFQCHFIKGWCAKWLFHMTLYERHIIEYVSNIYRTVVTCGSFSWIPTFLSNTAMSTLLLVFLTLPSVWTTERCTAHSSWLKTSFKLMIVIWQRIRVGKIVHGHH